MFYAKRSTNGVMEINNLTNLFSDNYNLTKKDTAFSCYKKIENFVGFYLRMVKPDLMIIINIPKLEMVFSKNFNLKFNENKENIIEEITKSIVPRQASKIFKVDNRVLEFILNTGTLPIDCIYQLKFTVNLNEGKHRTLFRNISFVYDNLTQSYLSVMSINDKTDMVGIGENASCKIKWTKGIDLALDEKMMCLEKELRMILDSEIKLTAREREILYLISIGKTSAMIAEELFISIATVNTHRQNLIRKFEVKNTASLINLIFN